MTSSITTKRIETGPVQFGDDWPGIFIRGDNALMGVLPAIRAAASGRPLSAMESATLRSLADLLASCGKTGGPVTKIERV